MAKGSPMSFEDTKWIALGSRNGWGTTTRVEWFKKLIK